MILYRTAEALFVKHEEHAYPLEVTSLDALIARPDLHMYLTAAINTTPPADHLLHAPLLAPIGNQEVWASGVTYYSSRRARIAESKDAGGGDFYDRVYTAERPELFFKAVAHKVAGPDSRVKIRRDATWSLRTGHAVGPSFGGGALPTGGMPSRVAGREVNPTRGSEKRRGANLPRRSAGMPPRSHNHSKRCQLI